MPATKEYIVVTIVAVIVILLFLGILFLVMIFYYSKKGQMLKEQQIMKNAFEKQLLHAKLEIQEQTFKFISQEIHDNVGQVLSFATIQLNIIEQRNEMDRDMLGEVKQSVAKAMQELRDIAKSLSNEKSHSFDLMQGVEDEVNRINRSGLIMASVDIKMPGQPLKGQYKFILFRLIQEGMQNILKHAGASKIEVSFDQDNEKALIMIRDNGIGFDVDAEMKRNSGLGLRNIYERAALMGGKAFIRSAHNAGTTISITIPYV